MLTFPRQRTKHDDKVALLIDEKHIIVPYLDARTNAIKLLIKAPKSAKLRRINLRDSDSPSAEG